MLAGLDLRAVVLNRPPGIPDDASQSTNARILRERLMCPVLDTADADWAQTLVNQLF